jgi:hypothetical protein
VRHAEREHRQVGRLEALRVQDRSGAEQFLNVRATRVEVTEQFRIPTVDPGCGGKQPMLDGAAVEGVQEQLEPSAPCFDPRIEIGGVARAELRHLEREERRPIGIELSRADPDDRHLQVLRKNGVEFGDPACPRVQVVASDAIDHQASDSGLRPR